MFSPDFYIFFKLSPSISPLPFLSNYLGPLANLFGVLFAPALSSPPYINLSQWGGRACRTLKKYHTAALLMRIVDWFCFPSKQWVQIECSLSPIPLTSLPWAGGRQQTPLNISLPFLTRQLYTQWNRLLASSTPISHRPGPMTPLFGDPDFNPALTSDTFLIWHKSDRVRMAHTLGSNHEILPYGKLQESRPGERLSWLAYWQLRSFLTDPTMRGNFALDKTPFEDFLLLTLKPSHILSHIYRFLMSPSEFSSLPFVRAWESELGTTFSEYDWQKSFILTHKLPMACFAQEKNYKILTRWYRYPTLLHRIYPSTSDSCWRCNAAAGTMLHIWWDCPLILPFWENIFSLYNSLTGSDVSASPSSGLLSMLSGPISGLKKGLLKHFLIAARTVIPRHWKSATPPSLTEWASELNYLMRMENLLADDRGMTDAFVRTWTVWSVFQSGPTFAHWSVTGSLD